MSGDPTPDARAPAWHTLRVLVSGAHPKPVASAQLAHAACEAEVECLALRALPELSPWLSAAAMRRSEIDVVMRFAEERIQGLLAEAKISRWIALKGSASAYLVYDESSLRARRDVDILVHPDDFERASHAIRAERWPEVTHKSHTLDTERGPFEREFLVPIGPHHTGLDLHQDLLRWKEFNVDTAGMIARGVTTSSGWRLCCAEDLLLHTALHAANAAMAVPLRSLLDIHLLLQAKPIDWEVVVERATAWRARNALWLCLTISQRWFDTPIPNETLRSLRPPSSIALPLGLTSASGGPLATGFMSQSPLLRTCLRTLLRDSPRDALHYLWQLSVREFMGLRNA